MTNTSRPRRARHPVARHGQLRSPHPLTQLLTVLGVMVLVVVTSGLSVGAFTLLDTARAVSESAVVLEQDQPLPPTIGEIEGGANILLVGTDSCEGQDPSLSGACRGHDTEGERNDVTMLVHISDNPRRVTVVSFPRDMLVPIPSCTGPDGEQYSSMSSQMINVSYMYGGLACTVKTVEALTGEHIQFAAAIRWTGVINMSDAIGGVDVCVTGDIDDENTGLHLTAGTHTLQGVQALQFLRIRHGIADGSDLGRISNQQQFMSSMVRKLQGESVLSNPQTLLSLATTAMSQVTQGQLVLSQSLTNPTLMVQIAMAVKDVSYADIVFAQYPTRYIPSDDRNDVVPVYDVADELFAALRANQALVLTGSTSQATGAPEVAGEATKPAPATPADPAATPEATDAAPPAEAAPPAAPAEVGVELPPSIAGTTAAQVTCTQPQS
ncbi:LCP family protein [Microbacterium sp. BWT-B31]|uniref:LCP family protein n=1 Tax=Microbacterium sp. BWT-B31 TaxID=3232072 RepID=UPI00352758C7